MTFLTSRFGITSTDNSTTTNLGSSGGYTGAAENVENYGDVTVNIVSNVDSASGGLQLQFSSNGNDWDIIESQTYDSSTGATFVNTNVKAKYFRIVYNNGSVAQTSFRLQTIFQQTKTASGGGGSSQVTFNDSLLDAFGRLKTSNPVTLLDITHTKDKNVLQVSESITGVTGASSTHNSNTSTVAMAVTNNGDKVIRQSRRYTTYQPGKSLQVVSTGILNAASNDSTTTSRIGYFDDDNGIFFQYSGGVLSLVKRKNGSDTTVNQNDWNIDKADGSGNSGFNIDVTKVQIFVTDIEWLGVGRVRCGLFSMGELILVHEFVHSNIETETYMQTANLPIRYEISSSGGAGTLHMICATVISDGGYNPQGKIFSANRGLDDTSFSGQRSLISLRLKSSGETGAEPRTAVNLKQFSVATDSTTGKISLAEVYLFQDTASPLSGTWLSADDESAVEYNITSGTGIDLTNAILFQSIYFDNKVDMFSASLETLIPLTSNINEVSDIFSLVVTVPSNTKLYGSATWEEIY